MRSNWTMALLMTLTLAAPATADGLADLDVPLNIQEWAGVDRTGEIVSTGIPLPAGTLHEPEGIAVFDAAGQTVPAQFKVLERWRETAAGRGDKSIKWLLVTFQVDIKAGQKLSYRLKAGENPPAGAPAKPFDGKGITLKLTLADGKVVAQDLSALEPAGLWEDGPVRKCVKWETPSTRGPDSFGLMVWAWTYAGSDRVDLTVVLKNTPNQPAGPMFFDDFSLEWSPAELAGAKEFMFGGEWGKEIAGTVDSSATLYQSSDGTDSWDKLARRLKSWRTGKWGPSTEWANGYTLSYAKGTVDGEKVKLVTLGKPEFRGYKVTNGGKEMAAGNFAQGYAVLNEGKWGGLMLTRDFLLQFPKAVEARPGTLVARLFPKQWEAHGGNHWLDDLQRKAHDLSFRLHAYPIGSEAAEAAARAFDRPLVIHCGTDWYRSTGAYGYISPRFKEGEVKVAPEQVSDGSSWITHGGELTDRIRRRYHQMPMGGFIRGGNPGSAKNVFDAMRHSTCVTPMWPDDYRYPRDAAMLKIGYCSPARGAGRYPAGTSHHGYMPWNNQHWMCEEIPDAWRLFGDPLAYDALGNMATYIRFYFDRRNSGKEGIGETRLDALPMVVIAHAYRILEDEALLESLRQFVRTTCARQVNRQRGYYKPNVSVNRAAGGSDKPFMISTLLDGIREYWQLSGDEVARDLMLGMTDFCIAEGFLNDRMGFRYTIPVDLETSRKTLAAEREKAKSAHAGGYRAWQMFRPLAWAYLHTGDEQYRDVFMQMCKAAKDATVWRHDGSPNPDSSDWGYICDSLRDLPEMKKADATPPPAVTDLTATAVGGGKVKLTWTTPDEAAVLRIKHAARPMVHRLNLPDQADTHANWWAADNVGGEPAAAPGKAQTMIVEGLDAGSRVFAIRVLDAADNRSGISNQVTVEVK